jgi:membrane associated rhomboid family serine protease
MTITITIIILTVITSISALSNEKVLNDLIFYPKAITYNRQWYRFISSGLIHADYLHLGFNMLSLYFFGTIVEEKFAFIFEERGKIFYLLMYITALAACHVPTFFKHRDNSYYRSLGASGAVSAVIFASILLSPLSKIYMLVPIGIPGFIYGVIYLAVSSYQDKRGNDNINHSAHIWGALYGMAFLIVMAAVFSNTPVLAMFVEQVKRYRLF